MPITIVESPADADGLSFESPRKMCRQSDGTLWCCFETEVATFDQIFIGQSGDGGVTWTVDQLTTDAWEHRDPSIAVDSNDYLHLVYSAQVGVWYQIHYQRRTTIWEAAELVTNISSHQYEPVIAIDSANNVNVAWQGLGWGANPGINNIQYRQRTAAAWQTQEDVTDHTSVQGEMAITIDSSDVIHLAWSGRGWGTFPASPQILYNQRTALGWQTQDLLTDISSISQYYPSIAVDSSNNVHLVWEGQQWDGVGMVMNIEYLQRLAGVWQAREAVTLEAVNGQRGASISLDSNDDVYVTWYGLGWGANPGVNNIPCRIRSGGAWGAETLITDNTEQSRYGNALWAKFPVISGARTNQPATGNLFVFNTGVPNTVKFYYAPDLEWPTARVRKGNIVVDQLIYQRADRKRR